MSGRFEAQAKQSKTDCQIIDGQSLDYAVNYIRENTLELRDLIFEMRWNILFIYNLMMIIPQKELKLSITIFMMVAEEMHKSQSAGIRASGFLKSYFRE